MCAADVFAVLGAGLEILGLLLVAWEIRDARRHATELGTLGHQRQQIGPAYEQSTAGALRGGMTPSVEERVASLEETAAALSDRMRRVDEQISKKLNDAVNDVYRAEYERDKRLRDFLALQLQGGLGKRKLGVALFIVGAIFSMLANLL